MADPPLASLLIWFLRRTTHLFENFRPLRNLLAGLVWSLSAALQQLPGEQRQRMRARLMGIRRKGEVFQLLVWPLLMITQIFGVFFNVGVLVALLLPLGRDVAFGWQSTVKTSPDTVYQLVSSIAAPVFSATTLSHREDVSKRFPIAKAFARFPAG